MYITKVGPSILRAPVEFFPSGYTDSVTSKTSLSFPVQHDEVRLEIPPAVFGAASMTNPANIPSPHFWIPVKFLVQEHSVAFNHMSATLRSGQARYNPTSLDYWSCGSKNLIKKKTG